MTATWMDINLLPPISVAKRFSFSVSAIALGVLTVCTVTFTVLGWSNYESNRSSLMLQNVLTVQSLQQSASIQALQAQLSKVNTGRSLTQQAGNMVQVDQVFKTILTTAPSGTVIQTIALLGSDISLHGQSSTVKDIAGYEDALMKLSDVSSVWVSDVSNGDKKIDFTMKVTLKGVAPTS